MPHHGRLAEPKHQLAEQPRKEHQDSNFSEQQCL
jgi:hypothetical protein